MNRPQAAAPRRRLAFSLKFRRSFRTIGLQALLGGALLALWAGDARAAFGATSHSRHSGRAVAKDGLGYRPGRLLVQPRPGVARADLDRFYRKRGVRARKRLGPPGQTADVVELPRGQTVAEALAHFKASGLAERVEPDYWLTAALAPNDPLYADGALWGLHNTGAQGGAPGADIGAEAAWSTITDARDVVVAVVDSGVRRTHEDLASNLWVNPGETGRDWLGRDRRSNGLDDDGNGYIDDVHGINAADGSGVVRDDAGHGTHVAGIIGAVGDNGVGVTGVAWNVRIMALKFLDDAGQGATSDAIECIDYARERGVKILNASWGGPEDSFFLERAVRRAEKAGMIVVAAAGNEANDNDARPFYPAGYDLKNVIAVAATTPSDRLASFSNYGARSVHIAAPGSEILSTFHDSDRSYAVMDGTSMAAPYVSGALALLRARFPDLSASESIQRLLETADRSTGLAGKCASGGRVNLRRALGEPVAVMSLDLGSGLEFEVEGNGAIASAPIDFSIANQGDSALDWKAISDRSWVTVTPSSGVVFPGETMSARLALNELASALPEGDHEASIRFVNLLTGEGDAVRRVKLSILSPESPLLDARPARLMGDSANLTSADFQFELQGDAGRRYIVEASPDLIEWTAISTNRVGEAGSIPFHDPRAVSHSRRFYRGVAAPEESSVQ